MVGSCSTGATSLRQRRESLAVPRIRDAFQACRPEMRFLTPVFSLQLCPDFMESDLLPGNHKAICTRTRVYGC